MEKREPLYIVDGMYIGAVTWCGIPNGETICVKEALFRYEFHCCWPWFSVNESAMYIRCL